MELRTWSEEWELWKPFRISRGVSTAAKVVVAEIQAGGHRGRGGAAHPGLSNRFHAYAEGVIQIWSRRRAFVKPLQALQGVDEDW